MKRSAMFLRTALIPLLAAACLPAFAQEGKNPPIIDQKKVDEAVDKGADWLLAKCKAGLPAIPQAGDGNHAGSRYHEMVLYTLLHAGVRRDDPEVVKLVNDVCNDRLDHTYETSIRALALMKYDVKIMRPYLIQCGTWLINNQGRNGQWGYGNPVSVPPAPKIRLTPTVMTKTLSKREEAEKKSRFGSTGKTQVKDVPKMRLQKRGWGTEHDNSNTQYALLGLWACMEGGIYPPDDVLRLTEKWFTDTQNSDGGWGYKGNESSYGSMTVGGVSSLSVVLLARGETPKNDPRIKRALDWLGKNLQYASNPFKGEWHYYWIYGVERAGSLADVEWFKDRPWYYEGAQWLISVQMGDGSWRGGSSVDAILDTCWAILFLRRASRPDKLKPVATGSSRDHQ